MSTPKHGWFFMIATSFTAIMSFVFATFIWESIQNHVAKREQAKVVQDLSCLKESSVSIATEGNCKISCQGEVLSVVCKTGD